MGHRSAYLIEDSTSKVILYQEIQQKLTVEIMKVFALLLVATVVQSEWVVQRGKNYLTCKNNNRISQYSADLATCQADAEAAGATHIFGNRQSIDLGEIGAIFMPLATKTIFENLAIKGLPITWML